MRRLPLLFMLTPLCGLPAVPVLAADALPPAGAAAPTCRFLVGAQGRIAKAYAGIDARANASRVPAGPAALKKVAR